MSNEHYLNVYNGLKEKYAINIIGLIITIAAAVLGLTALVLTSNLLVIIGSILILISSIVIILSFIKTLKNIKEEKLDAEYELTSDLTMLIKIKNIA